MPRFGSFEFDAEQRELRRDGQAVHLTPKAFDLLGILLGAAPRVVSKDELHRRMWAASCVSDAALVGLIKEVRRALDDRDRDSPMIRTVHRVGYAFCRATTERPARVSLWLVVGGQRVALHEGANSIGRDPSSTVWIDVASVSRRHAQIVCDGQRVSVQDSAARTEPRSVGRWSPVCANFATATSSHSGASRRCSVPRSRLCPRPLMSGVFLNGAPAKTPVS